MNDRNDMEEENVSISEREEDEDKNVWTYVSILCMYPIYEPT